MIKGEKAGERERRETKIMGFWKRRFRIVDSIGCEDSIGVG